MFFHALRRKFAADIKIDHANLPARLKDPQRIFDRREPIRDHGQRIRKRHHIRISLGRRKSSRVGSNGLSVVPASFFETVGCDF